MWVATAVGVGAGVGLIGSSMQADAASQAANLQYQATQNAQNQQLQMFNTLNDQQSPYRTAGYNALSAINSYLPYFNQPFSFNGNPTSTYQGNAAAGQQQPELGGIAPETNIIQSMLPSLKKSFPQLNNSYGTGSSGLPPNYEFMKQQGLGAISQNANVGGGGSNIDLARIKFAEDYASNAYQNSFQNYQTQQTNIFNRLASIAGLGQTAQGQTQALGQNTANAIGQLGVGGATALGAGQIGAANAIAGGLNGIGNAATLASFLNNNASGVQTSNPTTAAVPAVTPAPETPWTGITFTT